MSDVLKEYELPCEPTFPSNNVVMFVVRSYFNDKLCVMMINQFNSEVFLSLGQRYRHEFSDGVSWTCIRLVTS